MNFSTFCLVTARRFSRFSNLRWLRCLLWIGIVSANCALLLAYLLPQDFRDINPAYLLLAFMAFMVRSLQFQIALGLAGCAIIAILLRRRVLALLGFIPAIALFAPVAMQYVPKHVNPPANQTCRIMSMNLLYKNENTGAIVQQIRKVGPDIVLVEEFTVLHNDALQQAIGRAYPYQCVAPSHGSSGIGIFSRIPMRDGSDIGLFESNHQFRATLHLPGGDVALYAIHLRSPQSINSVSVARLQTADLIDRLRQEKLPIIVGGDFNFTADSPNAAALRELGLKSTHALAGHGRGTTWPFNRSLQMLPGIRIDHLMLSHQLACTRSFVGGNTGSDHRPIIADVGWRIR